jgi:hypothetical protein
MPGVLSVWAHLGNIFVRDGAHGESLLFDAGCEVWLTQVYEAFCIIIVVDDEVVTSIVLVQLAGFIIQYNATPSLPTTKADDTYLIKLIACPA